MADTIQETMVSAPTASTWKLVSVLSGVAALSGLLIVGVFQVTEPLINANREAMIERSIFTVVPGGSQKKPYSYGENAINPDSLSLNFGENFYAVYDTDGALVGIALETSAQGYQDVIRILYGYDPEKQVVTGMTVMESKETPGLGDKIAKDASFLANFEALDATVDPDTNELVNGIAVVKNGKKENAWEIDGITGATISSKAIGVMLDQGLRSCLPRLRPYLNELEKAPS